MFLLKKYGVTKMKKLEQRRNKAQSGEIYTIEQLEAIEQKYNLLYEKLSTADEKLTSGIL